MRVAFKTRLAYNAYLSTPTNFSKILKCNVMITLKIFCIKLAAIHGTNLVRIEDFRKSDLRVNIIYDN